MLSLSSLYGPLCEPTTIFGFSQDCVVVFPSFSAKMSKKTDTSLIAYKILTREHVKEATNLQIESSFQECLTIGFGIADIPGGTDTEGFEALLGSIIDDGFTIGAFDTKSNELVGVCFNKIHVSLCTNFFWRPILSVLLLALFTVGDLLLIEFKSAHCFSYI